MFKRKKSQAGSPDLDIQRLKQEIRAELARIHGGEPRPEASPISDAQAAPEQPQGAPVPSSRMAVAEPPRPAVSASPLIQQAALGQMRRMANGAATESAAASPYGAFRGLVDRFESTAAQLDVQVRRLLELNERLSAGAIAAPETPGAQPRPVAVQEPRFRPDAPAVQVTLAGVPSFPALMDVQHALTMLPATAEASVSEFDQGSATMQLALAHTVSLSEIMEGLRRASGHAFLVEESRPELSRLRLRFLDEPPARSRVLDPANWAKA